jgi:tetratricopeptide (TPR) repeat protein
MAIDPYAYCPCGSGKKVKFCCADLADDMERIQQMLEGGQRAAALEHIEKLEKTHPDNPYLVTTKALLQSVLGSPDKAAATLEDFLSRQPTNAMALAEKAVVDAARHGGPAGIRPLQQALEASEEVLSHRVVSGVARLGEILLAEGRLASARGHFMLAYGMDQADERSLQMLARFFSSPLDSLGAQKRADDFRRPERRAVRRRVRRRGRRSPPRTLVAGRR